MTGQGYLVVLEGLGLEVLLGSLDEDDDVREGTDSVLQPTEMPRLSVSQSVSHRGMPYMDMDKSRGTLGYSGLQPCAKVLPD